MESGTHVSTASGRNRKMASINEMLDDITDGIFQTEPFDQRTEVVVDSSLNYGLDLYRIVTGNETFDNRNTVQSDGLQFVEQRNDNNEEEEIEENSISPEMNTFNQFFNEAVAELQNNKKDVNSEKRMPSVNEEERSSSRRSDGHFSLRRIEAEFSKSDIKLKLLESIKAIGNEKGWYKKVDNFTAKLMNDNITAGKDIPFQEYVEQVSDYCLKTMPRLVGDKIKTEVKEFVTQFSKPFDEIYKEAVAEAASITPEELKKMREYVVKSAPLKPEIVYIGGPAISFEVSTQTKPMINESSSQTIEGLGSFDDKDFESIVKNHTVEVQMAIPSSTDYHSEEEPGTMSAEAEATLITKLETEVERQKRIKEDMRQALNPKLGLLLNQTYPDHREIIKKLKHLTEFDLEVFEDFIIQQQKIDKTLPPPEILTLKWNEKMYKFVTSWTWISPTADEKLPPEQRRKRVQKNEKAYLYIPPPSPSSLIKRTKPDFSEFECLFPIVKRRFGILEEYPTAPGKKKPRYDNDSDKDVDSDNDDDEDKNDEKQLKVVQDSDSSFSTDSDDDDDRSSVDSFELEFPHLFGRNKKRRKNKDDAIQANSEVSKVVKEKKPTEIPMEKESTSEVTAPEVQVDVEEIMEEEENGENGENDYNGIESCDEDELWDDFIPERVFAEKCPYSNSYNVDSFY